MQENKAKSHGDEFSLSHRPPCRSPAANPTTPEDPGDREQTRNASPAIIRETML